MLSPVAAVVAFVAAEPTVVTEGVVLDVVDFVVDEDVVDEDDVDVVGDSGCV